MAETGFLRHCRASSSPATDYYGSQNGFIRKNSCNRHSCCMQPGKNRSKTPTFRFPLPYSRVLPGFLALVLLFLTPASTQRLTGIRVERGPDEVRLDSRMFRGEVHLIERTPYTLRLFGHNLNEDAVVRFTEQIGGEADDCDHGPQTKEYILERQNDATGLLDVLLPKPHSIESTWYLCLRSNINASGPHFIHQGNASWLALVVESEPSLYMLPLPIQIITIVVLLCLSGLFSGLNLGVMSLDLTELKLIENSGTRRERGFAKKIRPVREHGNFLLCTILFGNVLVNSCLTLLLDDLTGSGLAAVASATMAIVIFGEIIPQSICSRHGLAVGAHTILLTQFFMVLTFPLSYPISRVLDLLLGEEIGAIYNRERLLELIRMTEEHKNLDQDEANIIAGALELRKKTVGEIMTPLSDVFMIPADAILNFDTVSEIMRQGYSRVPVYDTTNENIVTILNIKDLALVDPDDNTPVLTLCNFYNHHVCQTLDDTKLDFMLQTFRTGRTHLAFVQHIVNDDVDGRDPYSRTVGIVTLEDVIEEIIQAEIMDESDVVSSTRRRGNKRVEAAAGDVEGGLALATAANAQLLISTVTPFKSEYAASLITPQLRIASFQFLSTTLEPFKCELITPTILHRLTNHPDVAVAYRMRSDLMDEHHDLNSLPLLYQAGKPCDYFIIILEGRVEVKCGKEGITFQGGPFSYFGISALVLGQQEEELLAKTNRTIEEEKAAAENSNKNESFAALTANGDATKLKVSEANSNVMTTTKSAMKQPKVRKTSKNDPESENLLGHRGTDDSVENPFSTPTKAAKKTVQIVADDRNSSDAMMDASQTTATKPILNSAISILPAGTLGSGPTSRKDSNTGVFDAALPPAALGSSSSAALFQFIPDYDVRPVSDLLYMRIMRVHYLAAFRASQHERKSHDRTKGVRSAVEYLRAEFDNFTKPQQKQSLASMLLQRGMSAAPPPPLPTVAPHALEKVALLEREPASSGADSSSQPSTRPNSQLANAAGAHSLPPIAAATSGGGGAQNPPHGVLFSLGSVQNSVYSLQASNLHHFDAAAGPLPSKPQRLNRVDSENAEIDEIEQYLSTTSLNNPKNATKTSEIARRPPHDAAIRTDSFPSSAVNTPFSTPSRTRTRDEEAAAYFASSGDGLHTTGGGTIMMNQLGADRLSVKGARAHEKIVKQGQLDEWGSVGLKELKPRRVIIAPQAPDESENENSGAESAADAGGGGSAVKKFSQYLKTQGSGVNLVNRGGGGGANSSVRNSKQKKFGRSASHANPAAAAAAATAHSSSSSPSSASSSAQQQQQQQSGAQRKAPKMSVKVVLGTDSDPERELRDVK